MRISAVLAACVLLSTGCSAFVAASGKDLTRLTNRTQVQQAFGSPAATGQVDNCAFEEFTTHCKISESWKGIYIAMGDAATFGLDELWLLPRESGIAIWRSTRGQTLRFAYDSDGNVTKVWLDGEHVPFPPPVYPVHDARTSTADGAVK